MKHIQKRKYPHINENNPAFIRLHNNYNELKNIIQQWSDLKSNPKNNQYQKKLITLHKRLNSWKEQVRILTNVLIRIINNKKEK